MMKKETSYRCIVWFLYIVALVFVAVWFFSPSEILIQNVTLTDRLVAVIVAALLAIAGIGVEINDQIQAKKRSEEIVLVQGSTDDLKNQIDKYPQPNNIVTKGYYNDELKKITTKNNELEQSNVKLQKEVEEIKRLFSERKA